MRSGAVAVLVLLAGCLGAPEEAAPPSPGLERGLPPLPLPRAEAPPVRFPAWGDAGHGTPEQHAFAEALRRVCDDVGCDLAVGLGDNIYHDGVEGIDDPAFEEKFERPYRDLDLPMYLVLGNHDARGDAQAQVDYTNRSETWRMPARSYAFHEGPVLFLALDLTELAEGNASGAADLGAWVDAEVARAGDARWIVAYSHFPYLANGKEGSDEVRAFLERHVCGSAHLYLAGHEHNVQWLEDQPGCAGTELVVSGGASEVREIEERSVPARFLHDEGQAFVWFEAREDALVGRVFDLEGQVLFEREVTAARGEAASSPPPRSSAP